VSEEVHDDELPRNEEIVVRLSDAKKLTLVQRGLAALGYGLAAAIVTLSLAFLLSAVTGRSSLETRVDRNAELAKDNAELARASADEARAGVQGIVCLLRIVPEKRTDSDVNRCFEEFDKLAAD
jgi:hypothetical protein